MPRRLSDNNKNGSDAKNGEDGFTSHEDEVEPDEEAPLHRNIVPAPDEEAYTTDMEAVELRNIEPAPHKDAPQLRKKGSKRDEDVYQQRKNLSMSGEYRCRMQYLKGKRCFLPTNNKNNGFGNAENE